MAPRVLLLVKVVAVDEEVFAPVSTFRKKLCPLVQKDRVLRWFWLRYVVLEENPGFFRGANITNFTSCFQWVTFVHDFP